MSPWTLPRLFPITTSRRRCERSLGLSETAVLRLLAQNRSASSYVAGLLRYVHRHTVTSVRALAKALSRDYSNVHADVQALTSAGLLEVTDGRLRAEDDAIDTTIAI